MSDEDKVKILAYAKSQAESQNINANSHTITDKQENDSDDKGVNAPVERQANSAISEARGAAHSGDMRRMLGEDDSKTDSKKTIKARNVNWDIPEEGYSGMDSEAWQQGKEEYWNSDSDSDDSQNFH